MSDQNHSRKITVFYDGKCNLCSREINYYKRIANGSDFDWVDITRDIKKFEKLGFSLDQGLKILHVENKNGKIEKGVDGFIVIWKNLKYWKILAFIISLPIIRQIASFTYIKFAEWRFKKLGYCDIDIKAK
jgi:predicted DCC family thiol-disulfide oxidoreductase YuxK